MFRLLLIATCITFTACGYRLPGSGSLPEQHRTFSVDVSEADQSLQQQFILALKRYGAEITAGAPVTLTITSSDVEQDLVSIAEDGGPSLTRLTKKMSLTRTEGDNVIRREFTASEQVRLNPNDVLSDRLEQAEYEAAIDEALIKQVMTYLVYQSQ